MLRMLVTALSIACMVAVPARADSVFGDVSVKVLEGNNVNITWGNNGYSMVAGPLNAYGNAGECAVVDVFNAIDQEGVRGDYTKIDRRETPIGDVVDFMVFLERNRPGTGISVNMINCNRSADAPLMVLCADLEGTLDRIQAGHRNYGPEGCFRVSFKSQKFDEAQPPVPAPRSHQVAVGTVFGAAN